MPSRICVTVIDGRQASSCRKPASVTGMQKQYCAHDRPMCALRLLTSFKMLRHTVPEG